MSPIRLPFFGPFIHPLCFLSCKGSRLVGSWVRYPVWPHTFASPSADSRGAIVSYWRKNVHEVLVNRLGGLSQPRKSVVRLTYRPDMTLDVYRGRKTTTQQQKSSRLLLTHIQLEGGQVSKSQYSDILIFCLYIFLNKS